jgi:tryptophanyl-tRNA synthetase
MCVLFGFQPSGQFHLGNYFGAVLLNIEWQKQLDVSFFMIADLHSLTEQYTITDKQAQLIDLAASYLAVGLDPKSQCCLCNPMYQPIPSLLGF